MNIIGISGVARSGKDTFCSIAKDILENQGYVVKQYSFANALKNDVSEFLMDKCGVDVWTNDSEIKQDIRDFLVWYGTTWWRKRKPDRWIELVEQDIANSNQAIDYVLISDVRYENEANWVSSNNGKLIHITAYTVDANGEKTYVQPPNEQEKLNDPVMIKLSDILVEWEHKKLSPQDILTDPDTRNYVTGTLMWDLQK